MIALLLAAAFTGCGAERALVKNLLDHPSLTASGMSSVEELVALPAPRWSSTARRHRSERRIVTVDVDVIAFKTEADGDLHVIIRGSPGRVMIAELPLPGCVTRSPHALQMGRARASFRRLMAAHVQRLRLTGVVFFDKLHGQTGVAPNGVELHPVLKVEALP